MVNGHYLFTQFFDVIAMWNEANIKWSKIRFNTGRVAFADNPCKRQGGSRRIIGK